MNCVDGTRILRAQVRLTVATCVAGLVLAGAAAAATPAPLTPGSRYLALGDSVTFGYEEPGVVPAPNYHNASTFPGYPEQLGAELRLNVTNAACPGETSASLINAKALSNGCENAPGAPHTGYRTMYPLHVRYKGSQLAFALAYLKAHPTTRLVSLMIGANDLFLCQSTTKDACRAKAEFQAALNKVAGNVRRILSAIRKPAKYSGQLVIVNYYSLNYASALVNGQSKALNNAVDAAARPFTVRFADGFGELRAAAVHSGGSSCTAGLLTQITPPAGTLTAGTTPALTCGIHPSYAGQALLAQALLKVLSL